jgi:hypothetical protein
LLQDILLETLPGFTLIAFPDVANLQVGRQIFAGGSLLRSGQTQVGEPKIGEHAQ